MLDACSQRLVIVDAAPLEHFEEFFGLRAASAESCTIKEKLKFVEHGAVQCRGFVSILESRVSTSYAAAHMQETLELLQQASLRSKET